MNFKFSSSNHIIINIKINGIKGNFIVDSGASNSCVNYQAAKKFKLIFKKTKSKAYSAISNINEIFGNDILKEYKAIINYEEKKLILKL